MTTNQVTDISKCFNSSKHLITEDLSAHKCDSDDNQNSYKIVKPTNKQTPSLNQNQPPFPFSEMTSDICDNAKLFTPFLTPRSYLSLEQDIRTQPTLLDSFHEHYRVLIHRYINDKSNTLLKRVLDRALSTLIEKQYSDPIYFLTHELMRLSICPGSDKTSVELGSDLCENSIRSAQEHVLEDWMSEMQEEMVEEDEQGYNQLDNQSLLSLPSDRWLLFGTELGNSSRD